MTSFAASGISIDGASGVLGAGAGASSGTATAEGEGNGSALSKGTAVPESAEEGKKRCPQ